jgi:hypothetical protein
VVRQRALRVQKNRKLRQHREIKGKNPQPTNNVCKRLSNRLKPRKTFLRIVGKKTGRARLGRRFPLDCTAKDGAITTIIGVGLTVNALHSMEVRKITFSCEDSFFIRPRMKETHFITKRQADDWAVLSPDFLGYHMIPCRSSSPRTVNLAPRQEATKSQA